MSVTISAVSNKEKNGLYKGQLTIDNSKSGLEYAGSWSILVTIPDNSELSSCRRFIISKVDDTHIRLVPEAKYELLKKGKVITEKIEGKGSIPIEFIFQGPAPPEPVPVPLPPSSGSQSPPPPVIPSGASIVYNIHMNELVSIEELSKLGLTFQYSYPAESGFSSTSPNPAYFQLVKPTGLAMSLHVGDEAFKKGSATEPRTELRFLAPISDNKDYVYQWDQYLMDEPKFDYAWSQVFGTNGPAFILRWRSGSMQLLQDQATKQVMKFVDSSITPASEVGKWIRYRFEFKCSSKGDGYCKLYRNDVLMCSNNNVKNSIGANAYLKNGIYSQQMPPSNDVLIYKDNIVCYSL
jgi:hypothetical protein